MESGRTTRSLPLITSPNRFSAPRFRLTSSWGNGRHSAQRISAPRNFLLKQDRIDVSVVVRARFEETSFMNSSGILASRLTLGSVLRDRLLATDFPFLEGATSLSDIFLLSDLPANFPEISERKEMEKKVKQVTK
ncbi:hypothetical protein ACOSQ3_032217 [Xanthoceras sorbifolium]